MKGKHYTLKAGVNRASMAILAGAAVILGVAAIGYNVMIQNQVSAAGSTYYVSPSGSGVSTSMGSPGDVSSTTAKICDGTGSEINGTDDIIFLDGTYPISITISDKNCGSVGSHITLKSQNLHGAHISNGSGFIVRSSSHFTIDGFEISGLNQQATPFEYGMQITDQGTSSLNSHHIYALNNRIHDLASTGISSLSSSHLVIEGNEIYNTSNWDTYQSSAISMFESKNVGGLVPIEGAYSNIIRNNRAYNNQVLVPHHTSAEITDGNCIIIDVNNNGAEYLPRTLIANNECHDNARGIWILTSSHIDVFNNTVYRNKNTDTAWAEIGVLCEDRGFAATDINFANNIVDPGISGETSIVHTYSSWMSPGQCDMSNISYHNNIFTDDLTSSNINANATPTLTTSTNEADLGACTYNLISASLASINMASPGLPSSSNFDISPTSNAIDNGCAVAAEVGTNGDADLETRISNSLIDIGAHEYQQAAGNQTPTDLTASTPTIQENNATDTHISPITTTDPDNGDTHTYSLTCDTPGADDSRFQISATAGHIGHLHSNYVFDYETPADTGGTPGDNVYEVCVRTTDDGSPAEHYDKNVDITVTNDTGDDPDTTPPVITLIGANPQTILQNGSYVELGATANDNIDGDITGSIVIDASAVDTNTVGQYSVTYDVADAASNDAVQMVRTVDIIASDTTPPVITLTGANPQTITQGNSYVELGATATDNVDGDVTGSIVIDASAVDTNTLGQYVVTYDVSDAASNDAVQVTRTVDVTVASDTTPPVITLTGANPQTILQNGSYVELGATANDNVDGDISGSIVINASAVDTNTIGQYSVTYDVQDAAANDAVQMVRTVDVTAAADTTPPVITLLGANPLEIVQGATYTDPGATATDNVDGTLTSSIVVGGDTVDVNTIASYNVTYNVSDAASNDAAQQTRVVTVVAGGSGGPDPDGVDKAVEDAAPNSGDANGDGFQDSTQDNVASAPNPNNTIAKDAYVSLEASNGSDTNVTSFGFIFEPTSTPDATHDYPLGLFDFSLSVPNGATRTVTLYLDQAYDTSDWVWRKYNTTDNTYTDVPGVTYSTTTIGSNTVTTVSYALTDGGTNDEDGVANGTIVDPAGPAVLGGGLAATGDEIVRLSLMGALVIGTALLSLVAVRGRGYRR